MRQAVQEYYGKTLQSSNDLQTNACCTDASLPGYMKKLLAQLHDEVVTRYYGCGLVCPSALTGMRVLDLGCGSGRDCYILSNLVGPNGFVVGVDMTDEQLEVANQHIGFHMQKFGFDQPNIEFKKGFIEHLDDLGFADNSFDIIVSNCVINLSTDKDAVFREACRLLKPGGELYFSDVYADRRIPAVLAKDTVLYGECLSGALYWHDFQNLAKNAGFLDPRLVDDRRITIGNNALAERVDNISFFSATYRLFKLAGLEPACEDYGQAVVYNGTLPYCAGKFILDKHHHIETGRIFPVCGNTYRMLRETRFANYFDFIGSGDVHFGLFKGCGTDIPFDVDGVVVDNQSGGCC